MVGAANGSFPEEPSRRAARRGVALALALTLGTLGCAGGEGEKSPEPEPPLPARPAPAGAPAAPAANATPGSPNLPPGFPDPVPRTLAPDRAPTPYTAAEIRAACREGRSNTWRMVTDKGVFISVQRFVEVDAKGARIQSLLTTEDGVQSGSTESTVGTWEDFQSHASFPADSTMISAERIRVPAGDYDCWVYAVTEKDTLTTYWFAGNIPGPPIRVEILRADRPILTMELVEMQQAPPGSR